jgi:beta-phosphoglucomutase-like phosphatase (HAD superfamily)
LAVVIFDIDGTLVDSVDLHAEAWRQALRHFGYDVPFEQIRHQIGKGGDVAKAVIPIPGLPRKI